MIALTFSKSGREDIVLTEDDLFDFSYEENAYSGEAFELGGVCARSIYMIIDNNTQRFSRGTFANTRVKLEIDGNFYGYYNAELPKRRNGVIELTAYDDMVKLDVEFPTDYSFPQTFWAVYAQCVFEAGLAADISFGNVILNGVWDNGIISADYTDYIYANSCRNLVSGMAEWNGGFARINDDGRLQVDKFGTDIVREYSSGELMELDYSDDTVVFSKVKTSQKNKTYEKGDDSGYTLTLKNQYISYGLDDTAFETYLTQIYDYYSGFSLTPMSFTLAEPDFGLHVGDRVQVYDEEERVTICGNISNIEISGNCSMKVICGGFENVASSNNFTPTSFSQINQAKTEAQSSGSYSSPVLTEYEYINDLSVKYNGITYTAEKDANTGLIAKISDSSGNEFKPKINVGIADVKLHNAVFWAVAMHSGFERVAEKLLYAGENGAAEFSGGLTGFREIKGSWQANGGQNSMVLTGGCVAISIEKPASLTYDFGGYTDAIIVRSNEKINLSGYSKLRVVGIVFTNYPDGLTAAAYFNIGEPPAAQRHTAYDFTGWKQIDSTKYYSDNYADPGNFKIYDIDISKLSGEQYLNFAVYHGSEWYTNSCYFYIKKIMLIPSGGA